MIKRLVVITIVLFSILIFSGFAWASVEGSWEMTGKVTTSVKAKGLKTTTLKGTLNGDTWIFNDDYSFDSDNVGGTWNQTKTKFAVNFNDDDIILLEEEQLSEAFGTDVTVDAITKKTFTGTENAKKKTIKGSFKIYMNVSGYDEGCDCERTGKVTVSGSFTGTPATVTSADFAGVWKGNISVEGKNISSTLTLDSSLTGSYVTTGLSGVDTSNISGSVLNGVLSFNLPVGSLEVGNPDCANFNVNCSATLSQNLLIMYLSCSGTVCSASGGQPGSFTDMLDKQ
jgi:hypothetical protein